MSLTNATWCTRSTSIFAQLDLDVGPENVTQTAHEMGIKRRWNRCRRRGSAVSPIGVTPLEMADAYATLANGGIHHDPTAISQVEFPNGKVDESDPDSGERVLTEGQAYEVTRILEGVITAGHRRRLHLDGLQRRGRQDRHLGGRLRRLVRRLHAALLDRRLGRPPAVARMHRLRRPDRRPDLALLHGIGGGRRMPRIRGTREPARTLRPRQRPHLVVGLLERLRKEETYEAEEEETDDRADKEGGREGGEDGEATPSRPPRSRPGRGAHG